MQRMICMNRKRTKKKKEGKLLSGEEGRNSLQEQDHIQLHSLQLQTKATEDDSLEAPVKTNLNFTHYTHIYALCRNLYINIHTYIHTYTLCTYIYTYT